RDRSSAAGALHHDATHVLDGNGFPRFAHHPFERRDLENGRNEREPSIVEFDEFDTVSRRYAQPLPNCKRDRDLTLTRKRSRRHLVSLPNYSILTIRQDRGRREDVDQYCTLR